MAAFWFTLTDPMNDQLADMARARKLSKSDFLRKLIAEAATRPMEELPSKWNRAVLSRVTRHRLEMPE